MLFQHSYCFDDILMKPLNSNISTRNDISLKVNIATNGRELILKCPLISSPMDTVTETEMAIKMSLMGGLGIIHRFNTIADQVEQVRKVKRFLQYVIQNPYTLKPTDTYDTLLQNRDELGISSFCIVNDNNRLCDIITNRDLKFGSHLIKKALNTNTNSNTNTNTNTNSKNITIGEIQTIIRKQISGVCTDTDIEERTIKTVVIDTIFEFEQCITNIDNMRGVIEKARDVMIKYKIEKVPIVLPDNELLGLITWKNVTHFYTNEKSACLDKHGRLCVGAAIGIVGDYLDRLDALVVSGVDLICVDVANGFNTNVIEVVCQIRAKYPELVIMAGNVCEAAGFVALARTGVDCIRVGIGNGSICTTRGETGIGFGQFSAVNECFDACITNSLDVKIICDGGSLGKTGNKVKALASGASAIMLGRTLAATEESPGQVIIRNGRRFKYIRGMASTMANLSKQEAEGKRRKLNTKFTAEGVDGEQEMSGSVGDLIEQINGGLRSGLSYLGSYNISDLHQKRRTNMIKFCISTAICLSESGIRVKTY
jgi:IMP dehydrogenase